MSDSPGDRHAGLAPRAEKREVSRERARFQNGELMLEPASLALSSEAAEEKALSSTCRLGEPPTSLGAACGWDGQLGSALGK